MCLPVWHDLKSHLRFIFSRSGYICLTFVKKYFRMHFLDKKISLHDWLGHLVQKSKFIKVDPISVIYQVNTLFIHASTYSKNLYKLCWNDIYRSTVESISPNYLHVNIIEQLFMDFLKVKGRHSLIYFHVF